MKIKLHRLFEKSYKSRISSTEKLVLQTEERIADHGLTGAKKGLRAFSVTGDIRIVYLPVSKNEVIFINIGSYNQVY